MTQAEIELLIKDLSARLPYGVKVKTPYNDAILRGIVDRKGVKTTIDYTDIVTDKQTYPIRYIKPYLHPMSNMTDEEENEYRAINCYEGLFPCNEDALDYVLSNHFDYRGLIPKGLAIEINESNNPYKD